MPLIKFCKMKRCLTIPGTALLLLAAVSCNDGIGFEEYGYSERIALEEGRPDSLTIDINVEYPAKGMKGSVRETVSGHITATAFGEEYCGMDPQETIDTYVTDCISSYREVNLELVRHIAGERSMALSWERYVSGVFSGTYKGPGPDSPEVLNYTVNEYIYMGGAHGMNTEKNLVLDIRTGVPVSLEDIFAGNWKDVLPDLLMEYVPQAFEDPAYTDYLLTSEIMPVENFSMSDKGVTFIYNPYEIAVGAAGIVRITIPWDRLAAIVK